MLSGAPTYVDSTIYKAVFVFSVIQTTRLLSGAPTYVDPTIYKAVDEAVQEFAYELNRRDVTFGKLIGGGEFAEVFTGSLLRENGKTTNVAIKTLKVRGLIDAPLP